MKAPKPAVRASSLAFHASSSSDSSSNAAIGLDAIGSNGSCSILLLLGNLEVCPRRRMMACVRADSCSCSCTLPRHFGTMSHAPSEGEFKSALRQRDHDKDVGQKIDEGTTAARRPPKPTPNPAPAGDATQTRKKKTKKKKKGKKLRATSSGSTATTCVQSCRFACCFCFVLFGVDACVACCGCCALCTAPLFEPAAGLCCLQSPYASVLVSCWAVLACMHHAPSP